MQLSILSESFQADHTTLSMAIDANERAMLALTALINTNGKHLTKFLDNLVDGVYEGVELVGVQQDENFVGEKRLLVDKLIDHISNRLNDLEQRPILAAAKVLDPKEWPRQMTREELAVFGLEEINRLVRHFHEPLATMLCDEQILMNEWTDLKVFFQHQDLRNMALVWKDLFTDQVLKQRFGNILCLIECVLVLPVSTAVCERGFSTMKRVKSDWRSTLHTEMLRMLMFVSIEGPTLEAYDANDAFERWLLGGERGRRYVQGEADESSSDSE